MVRCIVPGCSSSCVSARFHCFPLYDRALCRSWLRAVRSPRFGADTEPRAVGQQRLKVCSEHFTAADYSGSYLKQDAVPSVFPWTGIRAEMLSQPAEEQQEREEREEEETSDKEESTGPVPTCSQIKEDPAQHEVKIPEPTEDISFFKSSEVLVNTRCLLELFKCCSVCMVECCVTVEGTAKLFAVIQDCESCGHHREWRSHPTPTEEPAETFSTEHTTHEDHEKHFPEEHIDHKEALDLYTASFPLVELAPGLEEEEDIKTVLVVPQPTRQRTKEVSMDRKRTIVTLRNEKKSIREIGKILGVSKSTVAYVLRKNASTGDISNRKRTGRPKKTTDADDQIILSIMMKNPQTPIQQIRDTLKEVGREVSMTTIRRKLQMLNHKIESAFLKNVQMAEKLASSSPN
ncbi:uncharacterized protein LOC103022935 [Astyanax mexicanus]|uniref:THAP domain-containing protein 1 n=1 Tax=Astyanax mexicanus TaxID=7994 RepID=A0A8T2LR31_ASTMX|nr:uncharacterized protein LOC103022935 [Astyanax mexicanus]KAG9274678.1 hypothetical protein AMEX_G11695 [Astyanax mexicanus]